MPVTFVDQLVGYLNNSANVPTFIQAIQLGAFAGESFTRRYGQNGFQVDAFTLGTPAGGSSSSRFGRNPRGAAVAGQTRRTAGDLHQERWRGVPAERSEETVRAIPCRPGSRYAVHHD